MTTILLLGTCDTKLEELEYLRQQIINTGSAKAVLVDVGRRKVDHEAIAVTQDVVLGYWSERIDLEQAGRGEVIRHMIKCATLYVKEQFRKGQIHGIISAGGSGGTSLAAAVMREALPIGFPKMIVSTVASGDTSPYVGAVDIALMYSVVDISGSNSLLHKILTNAAGAIVGMANASSKQSFAQDRSPSRKRVGITMFGVTTPGVDAARKVLETKYDCEVLIFHATGHGGQAMERLVQENGLDAVLDMTTTEICDYLCGGTMSAGPKRLEAAASAGIPCVISLGATSMANFGRRATVPPKYEGRLLYEHNPTVTLMRTNKEECIQIGEFIVEKLSTFTKDPDKVQVILPLGGTCMISTPGGPFADAAADEAMFEAIRAGLKGSKIAVVEDSRMINDTDFATEIAERLGRML